MIYGDIILRRGTPDDLSHIYRLERSYIEEIERDQLAPWQETMDRHIDQWVRNLAHTTVAFVQDMPAGYMFWERTNQTAELASVIVNPSYRRQGIATALIGRFEKEAKVGRCSSARLAFIAGNPAEHLYRRLGYGLSGTDGRYSQMTKHLEIF